MAECNYPATCRLSTLWAQVPGVGTTHGLGRGLSWTPALTSIRTKGEPTDSRLALQACPTPSVPGGRKEMELYSPRHWFRRQQFLGKQGQLPFRLP